MNLKYDDDKDVSVVACYKVDFANFHFFGTLWNFSNFGNLGNFLVLVGVKIEKV